METKEIKEERTDLDLIMMVIGILSKIFNGTVCFIKYSRYIILFGFTYFIVTSFFGLESTLNAWPYVHKIGMFLAVFGAILGIVHEEEEKKIYYP